MIQLHDLTAAIYNRAKSDLAGAQIRAAVGAGAASVITASKINKASLPARPFIALKRFSVPSTGALAIVSYRWFIYDDPAQDYRRIERLASLIAAAYPRPEAADIAPITIPGHLITRVDATIGDQAEDPALALYLSYAALAVYVGGPH